MSEVQKGVIKWFNSAKGFGFIRPFSGEEDVFVHHSAIKMGGYRTLYEGQPVEFEMTKTAKGFLARNVIPQEI
jgi:cold shock protein